MTLEPIPPDPTVTPPLASVITVVFNGDRTLERTIQSVLGQTYAPIEYIIVDGGSSDGTVDLIRRYQARIARWISEPDDGISDAFNKGIALASGAYVALINADDWMSDDQIARGVAALEAHPEAGYAFGDCRVVGPDGTILYRIRGNLDYDREIRHKMPDLPHPSVLARRAMYARFGGFDPTFHYAMDYEWLLRLHLGRARGIHVPGLTVYMRQGGESDAHHVRALREVERAAVKHGYPATHARWRFRFRVIKGIARRWLERTLPPGLRALPRRLINRQVAAAD